MKKSFMTRVVAVSLSAAMTFSLSAANMATASAATKYVALSAKSVTLKSGAKKTLTLKNNSLKWKVTSATSARKDVVTATKKSTSVVLKAKNCKKTHKNVKVTVKLKTSNKKKNNTKKLVCKVTVKKVPSTNPDPDDPNPPVEESVKISSATATSKANVDVKFSANVDRTTLVKENFKIAEAGVTVENVEVRDGMTVTLTLAGAEAGKTYTLNVTGLKDANGKDVDALSATFTMQADATQEYYLKLTSSSEKNQIKADGYAELPIICEVIGKDGQPITDKNYTIRFTTDRGTFSRPDVVTTGGKTENVLKSQALDVAQTAHVTAEIIRVEGTDTEEMRGKKGTIDINMTPELEGISTPVVVGAESGYADRITLFFQDAVEDDYFKKDGSIDRSKIKIEIANDITAQQKADKSFTFGTNDFTTEDSRAIQNRVVNIRPVLGNTRALQVLVNKPLSNNRHIGVRVQITDPTSGKTSTYLETFTLTDSETPRVLKVEPTGRRKLRVTYSEAVLPQEVATRTDVPADRAANYLVGGRALSNSEWGDGTNATSLKVGSGLDGAADRNVVDITLGKKSNGEYARFDIGTNMLTVQGVGDWAANTSGSNNIITTDSKNFTIDEDNAKPEIKEVEVQSPEQFLITFTAPVDKADSKDTFDNDMISKDGTAKSPGTNQETSIIQLQENGKNIGAKATDADSKNPIRVTKINEEQYLVETTKDWTTVYPNLGGTNDDYFYSTHNYKFVIDANKLVNINNGEKNTSQITYDLSNDPKMRAADVTPPSLVEDGFSWDNTNQKVTVKFNEPVKIRNKSDKIGLNLEGSTPSVKQSASTDNGIQQSTAQFISPKAGKTISGRFDSFTDATDTSVVIVPEEELTSSDDWTLHISNVSDDYGNATTVSKTFAVTSAQTGFKVAWAAVSTTKQYGFGVKTNPTDWWDAGANATSTGNTGDRYIFVKFTNAVNRNSILFDARNYSINSSQVPSDAYVIEGIEGYDDNSSVIDSVTIVIPRRSAYVIDDAAGGQNITLTISNRVTSSSNQTLTDLTEMALPYNHDFRTTTGDTRDAIFGDDPSEQLSGGYSNDATAYKAAVENAIKSDKYRKIRLSGNIAEGLNVSRPVDIDLAGNSIVGGEVKATFTDGATCHITNSQPATANGGRITSEFRISTPNADWKIGQNVECKDVNVRSMPSNTLTNEGTIETLRINTGSLDAKVVNTGDNGKITKMEIDNVSKRTITILNNSGLTDAIGTIEVKNGATIEIPKEFELVKGTKITNKGVTTIVVAEGKGKDVELITTDGLIKTLSGDTNKVTVKKDKDGDAVSASDVITTVTNTSSDSIKNAVSAAMVDSFSKTTVSGGAVALSKLLKNKSETIDENGAAINGYTIWAKAGSEDAVPLNLDGEKKMFATPDEQSITVPDGASDITIYIVKDKDDETETTAADVDKNGIQVKKITIK